MGRRIRTALLGLVGLLLAGLLVLEVFARVPADVAGPPLDLDPATRELVLIFHGRLGREDPSVMALEQRFQQLAADRPDVEVIRYIWSPYSDTRFRSNVNGAAVGRALVRELAARPALTSVHLIGHSAGAYVMEPLCTLYRELSPQPARITMTFLDPIGFAGVVDRGYGARHFGRCADIARVYLNTDDPVPATAEPYRHAFNIDVTAANREGFNGHRWPVEYYRRVVSAADLAPLPGGPGQNERGAVVKR